MRKTLITLLLILAALSLALSGCAPAATPLPAATEAPAAEQPAAAEKVLKLGVLAPFTGPSARV